MLSVEELREELHRFADNKIRNQLAEFAEAIEKSFRDEFKRSQHLRKSSREVRIQVETEQKEDGELRAAALHEDPKVDPTPLMALPGQLDEAHPAQPLPLLVNTDKPPSRGVQFNDGNGESLERAVTPKLGEASGAVVAKSKVLKLHTALKRLRTAPFKGYTQDVKEELEADSNESDSLDRDRTKEKAKKKETANAMVAALSQATEASPASPVTTYSSANLESKHIKSARDAYFPRAENNEKGFENPATPDWARQKGTMSVEDAHEYRRNSIIERAVRSNPFEYCVMVLITLNAIFIGVTTDSKAKTGRKETMAETVIELIFLTLFTAELLLRMFVYGKWFFRFSTPHGARNTQITWNILDTFIVSLSMLHEILRMVPALDSVSIFGNVSFLRMLRLLRIVRIARITRIAKRVREMHLILTSISQCFGTFGWSVMFLGLYQYIFAVWFTEAVLQQRFPEGDNNAHKEGPYDAELALYFGSITSSWFSLLKAVTGGVDWTDLSTPLGELTVIFGHFPFIFYLLFSVLAIMNVITGIFLEQATERNRHEKEIWLLRNARSVFRIAENTKDGKITLADFLSKLSHKDEFKQFFDAIDLDVQQAPILFELLDFSDDGYVSMDEFLRGCLRLRGSAKALDLLILSREVTQLIQWTVETINSLGYSHEVYASHVEANKAAIVENRAMLKEITELLNMEKKFIECR